MFHLVIERRNDLCFHENFGTWSGMPKGLKSEAIIYAEFWSNRKHHLHTTF